ncbi:MAG: chemotaxis protein CheD [Rubrivivax sp.]|nr:MAG: chemotaxis protein CheD [Rubrivivax sp.]
MDIFLLPGAYFVGDHRHRIRTLLGSCVSITLWHPGCRVGAMSHFLLSSRVPVERGNCCAPDPRYAEEALALMLDGLKQLGVPYRQCQAKIFGGGEMFPHVRSAASQGVGRKNGESARRLLEAHQIAVLSESLFGHGHRRIVFDVANGDVWSHQVDPAIVRPS